MRATYADESLSPHPLLETNVMSDFSRNFRELQKYAKRPYSLTKVLRELSNKQRACLTEAVMYGNGPPFSPNLAMIDGP